MPATTINVVPARMYSHSNARVPVKVRTPIKIFLPFDICVSV